MASLLRLHSHEEMRVGTSGSEFAPSFMVDPRKIQIPIDKRRGKFRNRGNRAEKNFVSIKRLFPSTTKARKPRTLTTSRREKIRRFVNTNNSNPKQYPFGKIGSKTWVRELIKSMKEPRHHAVIPSDVYCWLKTSLFGFFHLEHVRTALCLEQKCSSSGCESSEGLTSPTKSGNGFTTTTSIQSDSAVSEGFGTRNSTEKQTDDPSATSSSPVTSSNGETAIAAGDMMTKVVPYGSHATVTNPEQLSDRNQSSTSWNPGRSDLSENLPVNDQELVFTFEQFPDLNSLLQHLLNKYIRPIDIDTLQLFTTILIKLVENAKQLGTYSEAKLTVCHHALKCMSVTLDGMTMARVTS